MKKTIFLLGLAAATAAFRLSQRGSIGMMMLPSAASKSAARTPCPSLPMRTAAF